MKELKINVPKGYEIDKDKSTFENIVFKEINKLPSSWEKLEEISGYFIHSMGKIDFDFFTTSKYNKNVFKTKEQAEASTALAQLSQLRDVYRQGWVPNWELGSLKYAINLFKNELSVTGLAYCNYFLTFQDRETAKLFLENFRDLIEKAKPLMS